MKLLRGVLLLALCVWGSQAFALTSLGKHTMAVAQSMSAFYMVSLTGDDTKYEAEFNAFADVAEAQFKAGAGNRVLSELQREWRQLRSRLVYDYMGGAGLTIGQSTRQDFRNYLTRAYQGWLAEIEKEPSAARQLEVLTVKGEVISARYFDISSTIATKQDPAGLEKVNPTADADLWLAELKRLKKVSSLPVEPKALDNVANKWRMMQKALAKYQEPGAYFLLYYNKQQIHKQLMLQS